MSEHDPQLVSEAELTHKRPGRPPAVTREAAENLIQLVESGFTLAQACALEGIGRSTVSRYLAGYPGFRDSLTRARRNRALKVARLHQEAVEVAAATGDWRAIHVRFESELRQLEREIAQGSWNVAIDEALIDLVTDAVQRRLDARSSEGEVAEITGGCAGEENGTGDHGS